MPGTVAAESPAATLADLLAANPTRRYKRLIEGIADRGVLWAEIQRARWAVIHTSPVRWDARLPADYGIGHDERVIEIPLALEAAALEQPGFVLDAGCALNHHQIDGMTPGWRARVLHYTQAADKEALRLDGDQRSYLFGDLRRLDFRDATFDRIVCVSTLEHVGMDNSRYGGAVEHEPWRARGAWCEMLRVLKPGGRLLLTVPYGPVATEHGWYRVFGPDDIDALLAAVPLSLCPEVRYFQYDHGWRDGVPVEPDPHEPITGLAVIRI